MSPSDKKKVSPDPALPKNRGSQDEEDQEKQDRIHERKREPAPKGTASARERISDAINPADTGERGPTGPAAI